jgi:hypothetical protein
MVRAGAVSQDNADDPVKVYTIEYLSLSGSLSPHHSSLVDQPCARRSNGRWGPCSGQSCFSQNDHERTWGAGHGSTHQRRIATRDPSLGIRRPTVCVLPYFALRETSRFELRTPLMPGCPFYSYMFPSPAAEVCFQNLR